MDGGEEGKFKCTANAGLTQENVVLHLAREKLAICGIIIRGIFRVETRRRMNLTQGARTSKFQDAVSNLHHRVEPRLNPG